MQTTYRPLDATKILTRRELSAVLNDLKRKAPRSKNTRLAAMSWGVYRLRNAWPSLGKLRSLLAIAARGNRFRGVISSCGCSTPTSGGLKRSEIRGFPTVEISPRG